MIDQSLNQAIFGSSILIVDDNAANVELLREILYHQGYTAVRGVTDSRTVSGLCSRESFDIILLDIRMPHLNGFQLIDQLAPIYANDFVPILVLTAQTDQETRRRALEVGASDFLTKPFVAWELLQRVRNMLHNRILYKEVRSQNRELERRVIARTAELSTALDAARKADRAKLDFLAVMSHELRTPLNAIIGFAELIVAPSGLPPERSDVIEYGELIESSGRHLLSMVNRILDISRGTTGTLHLADEKVDLGILITSCVQALRNRAQERNVNLTIQSSDPCMVNGDERRLREVILSLLDNAIKFNRESGNVRIQAGRAPAGSDVEILIDDDGPGMAPELRARVFDPFNQAGDALRRHHEGIGLGLPLVQRLVQLHGGRVEIDSVIGQGTTVRVILPVNRPAQ